MSATPDTDWFVPGMLRLPVAVLALRRPSRSPWADWSWRVSAVLEDAPDLPDWTALRDADGGTLYLAGRTAVALYPSDSANYRDNLAAATPLLWVVLRPVDRDAGMALHMATIDGEEAQLYAESGNDLLEALAMPPGVRTAADAFVAQHYVERVRHKRRRS